jgi:excisionase family DNA binding protein
MVDAPHHESLARLGKRGADSTSPPQQAREKAAGKVAGLLHLRFDIAEAASILKFSRATLYSRISDGVIRTQKDGRRTYITRAELERYVASRD